MTQNLYDNPTFFAAYSQLERSVAGLDGAAEWPTIRTLLPDLRSLNVLDLGCGYGWFCRWAREQGAATVTGLDVSEKMLARAAEMTSDAAITYAQADLEAVTLPDAAYGLVYSSLAFHYLVNLPRLMAQIHASLLPGGSLVFSVEHPLYTAPTRPGWSVDADGRKTWPLDAYLNEGERITDWLAPGVRKQHRTLATYVNLLIGAGFALTQVVEWGPTPEQIAARPDWADERERPPFLLVAARRL